MIEEGGKALAAYLKPREERSEEHTSELQSQSNLVCRLLLEKKKQAQLLHLVLGSIPPPQNFMLLYAVAHRRSRDPFSLVSLHVHDTLHLSSTSIPHAFRAGD